MNIFESASKIVFILITIGLLIFTATGIVEGAIFAGALGMVYGYYFKSDRNTTPSDVK